MTIDRLGPVDPVAKINKANKTNKTDPQPVVDTIDVSEEARRSVALQRTMKIVRNSPNIRMDRVKEVQAKLNDPNYINDKVIEDVANNLLDVFGY